jgi:hypothetical protein
VQSNYSSLNSENDIKSGFECFCSILKDRRKESDADFDLLFVVLFSGGHPHPGKNDDSSRQILK